ncbi:MAG TPA: aldolase/citrate lyase family protein [Bryobacteraceae bacterium]|nr:aldolase/citrate lyase family protein [Bryobacteraceae bacterium]HPT25055.1 aldolase/citrate lyase family protein [Bryobacteraceae bacterium]
MKINTVKQALKQGRIQIGTGYQQFRSQDAIRALASAGFDWAFLDGEHGGFSISELQDLCRMAAKTTLSPIVRVADLQYSLVARALDCGAEGVIFPRVEDPELLQRAVSWTKFPPEGIRGCGLTPLHIDFEPASIAEIMCHANEHTMVVLQIETVRAVEAMDELLSVPSVDTVMIGPVDLSISLGVPGEFEHPKMLETVEKIVAACKTHGVVPGAQARNPALARRWKEMGMLFVGCGSEVSMLYEKGREVVAALR